jgi:sugar phosphate isomerase/epimerase
MTLGINLCFAVKRYLEPQAWAEFVRADLGLDTVQYTFDLLDPWWPAAERDILVDRVRSAAEAYDITIHSAYVGLAHYVPAGLLDPDPEARAIARQWWQRACEVTARLGARAVGGPLGTMSVRQAAAPDVRADRYRDLLESIEVAAGFAAQAGLEEFLIEPTPIAREIPSSMDDCCRLMDDLRGRTAVPVGFTLDTGHTVYEPLYGPTASVTDWISGLGGDIRLIHLDNTDRRGDQHWGWPHPDGCIDVPEVARALKTAGLADVPAMLEIYPRFEDADDHVTKILSSSVEHCREHLS